MNYITKLYTQCTCSLHQTNDSRVRINLPTIPRTFFVLSLKVTKLHIGCTNGLANQKACYFKMLLGREQSGEQSFNKTTTILKNGR